jgi:formamidopyrimidine-DNA glycosylase
MPELPEVETVVRGLRSEIVGQKIIDIKLSDKKLRQKFPENITDIIGSKIRSVERRSKYIIINLDNSKALVVHLGMSGKLLFGNKIPANKHDHVKIKLSHENLVYNDPRRFGLVTLVANDEFETHPLFNELGVEPLTDAFDANMLKSLVRNKVGNIKSFIMNAKYIVGVGNIYACESLFYSGIHPLRQPKSLTDVELKKLVTNIKKVLKAAIESGGSTLRDYVRSNGDVGSFQHEFAVYGRKGQSCKTCGTKIDMVRMAGRSTFFCPKCQG